jgi:trimethylamine:corrinoid methyltransferase-like protein
MREEQYLAQLSDREDRTKWEAEGAKDASVRASERVKELLSQPLIPVISDEIRERLKREIPGLRPSTMDQMGDLLS